LNKIEVLVVLGLPDVQRFEEGPVDDENPICVTKRLFDTPEESAAYAQGLYDVAGYDRYSFINEDEIDKNPNWYVIVRDLND